MNMTEPIPDDGEALVSLSGEHLLSWRRASVQGREARYGDAGDGPTVLFLHGWALSHRTYRAALKRLLQQGLRVVAPALPGFGGSAPVPGAHFDLPGYATWVADLLEVLEIVEPVLVMGHSFGGGVATQLAHDHPERVRALVLLNSIGGSVWHRHGSVVRSMKERPLWDWGLHFPRDLLPNRQVTRVLPVILRDAVPNFARDPVSFVRAAGLARTADLTHELETLRDRGLPIVVLWGEQDRIIPQAASEDLLAAAAGGAHAVTVRGTHSWMLADPDEFGEVMTNVLEVAERAQAAQASAAKSPARRRRPA